MGQLKSFLKKIKLLNATINVYRKYRKWVHGLNISKTIYFNLKFFGFFKGIKLPVFLYGKVAFGSLSGKIQIIGPIHTRMIVIGKNCDGFSERYKSLINIPGSVIFRGEFMGSCGVTLESIGTLDIGRMVSLGTGAKIRCWNEIKIGSGTGIVEECQVFDTNFHAVQDVISGQITNPSGTVRIGEYCWIGNRTTIAKGTILPNHTIVASNSLVNKDFTFLGENLIIAGIPAKKINENKRRVYLELEMNRIFYNGDRIAFSKNLVSEKQNEEGRYETFKNI